MKRSFWILLMVLIIGLFSFSKVSLAKTYVRPIHEPAVSNSVSQSSQENERMKELLEIWKDHVRTITKERDEAYKEIEALKNRGSVSLTSKAQGPTTDPEKEDSLRQLEYLKDKMALLQKKYDQLRSTVGQNGENRVNTAQLAALQAKAEKLLFVEKELQEARDYFSSYMKELDAKNKSMLQENETLKSELQNATVEKQKQDQLEQELGQLKSENHEFQKNQVEQSKTIKNFAVKNKSMLQENEALKSQLQNTAVEKQKLDQLEQELGQLKSENDQLQNTKTRQLKIIQTLKSNIQSSLDSLDSNCGDRQK